MLSLFIDAADQFEIFESTAHDAEGLLQEVSRVNPDLILLEESAPLSAQLRLCQVLTVKPYRPVIMISQEHNWMHVIHRKSVQLNSASDLIDALKIV